MFDNDEVEEMENEILEPIEETDLNLSEIIQASIQSFEPFVLDEKKGNKTTCLKTISSKQKLSKDRLSRVQGMSAYPCENSSSNNIDSFLLNEDPVLVNGNDGLKLQML